MATKSFLVLSVAVAVALPVFAQQQGGGGGKNTGNRPPESPGGRQEPSSPRQQRDPFGRQQDPFGQRQQQYRPIFLSGQVVLDDGNPPPEPVAIERTCNGRRVPETYTDRKGHFSFQLGANPSLAMSDASSSGVPGGGPGFGQPGGGFGGAGNDFGAGNFSGPGRVDLTGCELRADLPGYRSDVVQLGRRSVFDRPDVGVIVLHRLGGVRGNSVSVTTLAAPKKAKKFYNKAAKQLRKKNPRARKPEKAIELLEKAVAEYPEYAAAWTLLGETRMQLNDPEGAREAFKKAMASDPKYLKPYPSLLQLELQQQRWEQVADVSAQLLKLNPMRTEVKFYEAVADFNLGNFEEAEQSALQLQKSGDAARFPQVHHLLGMIHAKKGNFPMAAAQYRSFVQAQPASPVAQDLQRQLTEWEALGVIKKQETANK